MCMRIRLSQLRQIIREELRMRTMNESLNEGDKYKPFSDKEKEAAWGREHGAPAGTGKDPLPDEYWSQARFEPEYGRVRGQQKRQTAHPQTTEPSWAGRQRRSTASARAEAERAGAERAPWYAQPAWNLDQKRRLQQAQEEPESGREDPGMTGSEIRDYYGSMQDYYEEEFGHDAAEAAGESRAEMEEMMHDWMFAHVAPDSIEVTEAVQNNDLDYLVDEIMKKLGESFGDPEDAYADYYEPALLPMMLKAGFSEEEVKDEIRRWAQDVAAGERDY